MGRWFYSSRLGLFKTLSLTLLAMGATSFKASMASAQIVDRVKTIRFSLDPAFLTTQTQSEILQNLTGYVDDMNIVYGRDTSRQFSFDPATGVEFFTTPITGGRCYPVDDNHNLIVQIRKSTLPWSHGGAGGCNFYNDNQLYAMSLHWTRIYSRAEIAANSLLSLRQYNDYFIGQFMVLIHEVGHLHGLGNGEYYSLNNILDNTGVLPNLSIKITDPNNFYGASRQLIIDDPMRGVRDTHTKNLDGFIFSPLSATLINRIATGETNSSHCGTPYYGPLFCFDVTKINPTRSVTVQVLKKGTQTPVQGCTVSAYRQRADTSGSFLIAQKVVDVNGRATFELGSNLSHNSISLVAFFKSSCPWHQPAGDAISIFDLQASTFVPGGGASGDFHYDGNLEIYAEAIPDITPPTASILSPSQGAVVKEGSTVSISFAASDDRALSDVRLTVNNTTICRIARPNQPYICNWKVPATTASRATITVTATDRSGNQTSSSIRVAVIDTTAPEISLLVPAQGSTSATEGTALNVTYSATDNRYVSTVQILVDGNTICTIKPQSPLPQTCVWNVPDYRSSPTPHTVQAVARDAAGNMSSALSSVRVLRRRR